MVIEWLTAALVVITAVYAYLTHRIAKASEASVAAINRQSEASLRPYITASPFVRPKALFLYLRVANSGRSSAENVRLTLDRDFLQWGKTDSPSRNLRNQNSFALPIDSLAPGTEELERIRRELEKLPAALIRAA